MCFRRRNADPTALQVAVAAAQADFIGMLEGRIMLSQVHICSWAPKSNGVIMAVDSAMEDVKHFRINGIPSHLRDAHYSGAKSLDHGQI